MTIIWYLVPEIWSASDRIFLSFSAMFCPFTSYQPEKWKLQKMKKAPRDIIILQKCAKNHDHMLYCSWDMVRDRCSCYFSFWAFYPLNSPKNETFMKMKKSPGHIIILQNCTKNHDHMLYCSWDMVCDRCNRSFSFWAIFRPFIPLTAREMKIFDTRGDIIILQQCAKNHDDILYCSWNMARDTCNCYFPFWAIFCSFTPLTAQKILYLCTKNYDHMMYGA